MDIVSRILCILSKANNAADASGWHEADIVRSADPITPSSISKAHSCLPGSLSTFSSNEDPVSSPPSKGKTPFLSTVISSSPSKHSASALLIKQLLSSKSIFL